MDLLHGPQVRFAIEQALRVTHLEPEFPSAQYILGLACEQKRRYGEARAALDGLLQALTAMRPCWPASGGSLRPRAIARKLSANCSSWTASPRAAHVAPFWYALVYAGLGDADAIGHLERSYAQSDVWLVWINTDPRLDCLRADSRFQDLLRRVGFHARAATV